MDMLEAHVFWGGQGFELGIYRRVSHYRNARDIPDGGWLNKNTIS